MNQVWRGALLAMKHRKTRNDTLRTIIWILARRSRYGATGIFFHEGDQLYKLESGRKH